MKSFVRSNPMLPSVLLFAGWLLALPSVSLASIVPVAAAPRQETPAEERVLASKVNATFHERHFVPNNMAFAMTTGFDFGRATALATAHYGHPEGVISRTEAPVALPDSEAQVPPFVTFALDNGLTVVLVEQHAVPVMRASLYVGSLSLEEQGVADLLAAMLAEDTSNRTAEEIAAALESIGGTLDASVTPEQVTLTASGPSFQHEALFDVMAGVALHPIFPADKFAMVQEQMIAAKTVDASEPTALATRHFRRIAFGDDAYGYPSTGERMATFTPEDLANFYATYFRPNNALLVITGDLSQEQARAQAEQHFGAWEAAEVPNDMSYAEISSGDRSAIHLVDVPDAVDAAIRVGNLAMPGSTRERFALIVANHILGGRSPNSRLSVNLRVNKRYTHGVRSMIEMQDGASLFVVGGTFGQEVAGASVREILAEIERLGAEPLTAEELISAKSFLASNYLMDAAVPAAFANLLATTYQHGLSWETVDRYVSNINAVTPAQVQEAAQRYMDAEHPVIVVVGNAAVLLPQLQALGDVVVVDAQGVVVE